MFSGTFNRPLALNASIVDNASVARCTQPIREGTLARLAGCRFRLIREGRALIGAAASSRAGEAGRGAGAPFVPLEPLGAARLDARFVGNARLIIAGVFRVVLNLTVAAGDGTRADLGWGTPFCLRIFYFFDDSIRAETGVGRAAKTGSCFHAGTFETSFFGSGPGAPSGPVGAGVCRWVRAGFCIEDFARAALNARVGRARVSANTSSYTGLHARSTDSFALCPCTPGQPFTG